MSLNHTLAELFARMAAIMEIRGESAFKSIAFHKVSRLLKDATQDVAAAVREGTLAEWEGVGASSRKIIEEVVTTGRSSDFEQISASIPAGLLPMLDISGLGPKTIALFWKERGITSIEQLAAAIDSGGLAGLKGIGEKKIAGIKDGIALLESAAGRLGIGEAEDLAVPLLEAVRGLPLVARAEVAGSLRRRKETIGDVDILACLKTGKEDQADAVLKAFSSQPGVARVLGSGTTKASVLLKTPRGKDFQVDLRIVPAEHFGAALMYFTGSKEHNVKMRQRALDRGMTLNEWGLYRQAEYDKAEKVTGQPPAATAVAAGTEAEVFAAMELAFVEPELREDRGELALAESGKLPKLIGEADLRGDLHSHTTASDGTASIIEMAHAAMALGYGYLAVTDHSKSQGIARGLDETRMLKHIDDIRAAQVQLNKGEHKFRLLVGSEVDILADGSLDYADEILAQLDWVVASPHVSLKQERDKATARIIRAIENPFVNVIGHPTGRLLLEREGLPLEFEAIFKAAAETGTALEINSGYPRLDLSEQPARAAAAAGVMLTIDTDAHSTAGLSERHFGIGVARRAGLTAANVLNTRELGDVLKFVAKKRGLL
jgi:DNA polymerase (family 10)